MLRKLNVILVIGRRVFNKQKTEKDELNLPETTVWWSEKEGLQAERRWRGGFDGGLTQETAALFRFENLELTGFIS